MKTFTLVISLCTLFFTAACKYGNIQDRLNNPGKYFPGFDEPEEPPPEDPSLVISPENPEVTEGCSAAFTVALPSDPLAEVTLDMSLDPADVVMIAPSSLTFTPGNYNTAQTVTLSSITDDTAPKPAQVVTVTISSSDETIVLKSFTVTHIDYDCDLGGTGTMADPYLVCSRAHLEMIDDSPASLDANYRMTQNIDLSRDLSTRCDVNWTPLSGRFTGTFDGGNFKIQNLVVSVDTIRAGFFEEIGTGGSIQDLVLEEVNVASTNIMCGTTSLDPPINIGPLAAWLNGGEVVRCAVIDSDDSTDSMGAGGACDYVGGLVGRQSGGSITGSRAEVGVDGGAGQDDVAGGLVGEQSGGSITDSYATGDVDGGAGYTDIAGGLVGRQSGGSITGSYATGDVNAGNGNDQPAGGLVGEQSGGSRIVASYATGNVSADEGARYIVGGLVGRQSNGSITASYATGNASGGDGFGHDVGGLVGGQFNANDEIIASYATGNVDGGDENLDAVGGLVGRQNAGNVMASYATGNVNGGAGDTDAVGGLVGRQADETARVAASYATGNVDGGAGTSDTAGSVVGIQGGTGFNQARSDNSYGFGAVTNEETSGVNSRPGGVTSATGLIASNAGGRWTRTGSPWSFGTASQPPVLRYITDSEVIRTVVNPSTVTWDITYSCMNAATLLPGGVICGTTFISGQGR